MWISKLTIQDIRGFINSQTIDLSHNINLFVGQNNAGKSTLLNSILLAQNGNVLTSKDISLNKKFGKIELIFENLDSFITKYGMSFFRDNRFRKVYFGFEQNNNQRKVFTIDNNQAYDAPQINSEPQNLIYPYLSKRKVISYNENVNLEATNSVIGNFQYLSAKIARLCNVNHPKSLEYQKYCNEIIGFPISTVASSNGQKAAYIIESFLEVPLESMGEGVSNLLGLIVDLCIAEDKIFLIEEPENDIHPQALKSLLELIARKSETNQFFISTHSNIVTKYLGSVENSKVFRVSMSFDNESRLPVSKVEEVDNEPTERLKLLEELGYEPFDFGQFSAWLFLEESSAETIIKDFLIPNFVPKLKTKLRTYSAGSRDEVEKKFRDFNNLFVFIHLEPTYKNKAWVLIDSGKDEEAVIERMKLYYLKHGWNEDNFLQLSKHNFEEYYPHIFQEEFEQILLLADKGVKKPKKKQLLEKVLKWIEDNPEDAKTEFAISAKDVIDILKKIAKQIN